MVKVTRARFHELAEKALSEIPKFFLKRLYNVEIDVKARPGPESGKWNGSSNLLGLYHGLKRDEMKSTGTGGYLPARIVLYQRNLEALCASEEELERRIRLTLRHEIAHHFGFSEEQIRSKWPEGA
jgi:predicted Zn-dependent protease with MMP-like domain